MDCPEAYREALIRDFSSATNTGQDGVESRGAAAPDPVADGGSANAMAATAVSREVIDQRRSECSDYPDW